MSTCAHSDLQCAKYHGAVSGGVNRGSGKDISDVVLRLVDDRRGMVEDRGEQNGSSGIRKKRARQQQQEEEEEEEEGRKKKEKIDRGPPSFQVSNDKNRTGGSDLSNLT